MTKILYEFELLWLLSKAVANAAFRSNPTPQWWSECSARTMVPISTGRVQQNISLTGLLATVTQTTKEKCLQNSPLSPMLFMHQCPTKWQSQDQATSTISLSTRKPKFSLLCQKPKTWPQLQAPAHTVGEGTGGAHQPSLKAPSAAQELLEPDTSLQFAPARELMSAVDWGPQQAPAGLHINIIDCRHRSMRLNYGD